MMTDDNTYLRAFVRESNRIEGIRRAPFPREVEAVRHFLALDRPRVLHMIGLVGLFQPGAYLRDIPGLDVRVGDYVAPKGGPYIRDLLVGILAKAHSGEHPYLVHQAYEHLHPFTDGNGRSGRALWLWQMVNQHAGAPLGFLHHWYYQSLENHKP